MKNLLACCLVLFHLQVLAQEQNDSTILRPGIHEQMMNYYDNLGISGEDEWAMYHGHPDYAEPVYASGDCKLEKEVYGWYPHWGGRSYQSFNYKTLSTLSYFSYLVNPANGEYEKNI